MTQTATNNGAAASNDIADGAIPNKKPNRRSFTERLSDLSLEEKVEVIKRLKQEVARELGDREALAKIAKDLTEGL